MQRQELIISYDNMCHLNNLKVAKKPFPLPGESRMCAYVHVILGVCQHPTLPPSYAPASVTSHSRTHLPCLQCRLPHLPQLPLCTPSRDYFIRSLPQLLLTLAPSNPVYSASYLSYPSYPPAHPLVTICMQVNLHIYPVPLTFRNEGN